MAVVVDVAQSRIDPSNAIVGYVVAGLLGLWLLYCLRQWCSYRLTGVQSDANRALYAASMGAKPKPRFPIFSFLVSLFITVKPDEIDFVVMDNDHETAVVLKQVKTSSPTGSVSNTFSGVGAFVEGPTAAFRDLEANQPSRVGAKDKASLTIEEMKFISVEQLGPAKEAQEKGPNDGAVLLTRRGVREGSSLSRTSHASSDVDVTLSAESSVTRSDSAYSVQEDSISDAERDLKSVQRSERVDGEAVLSSHCGSAAELSDSDSAYSWPDGSSLNAYIAQSYAGVDEELFEYDTEDVPSRPLSGDDNSNSSHRNSNN